MIPMVLTRLMALESAPRIRGDDPEQATTTTARDKCSPHPRG